MHTFKVASRIHLSTKVPYKYNMKSPNNNKKRHLYINAYIAAPTAVMKAAIDIKMAKD